MHKNDADIIDRGWDAMHDILDKEMPEKRKRRGFFFLLGGLSSIAIVLLIFMIAKKNTTVNDTIQQQTISQDTKTDRQSNELTTSSNSTDIQISFPENKLKENKETITSTSSINNDGMTTTDAIVHSDQKIKAINKLELNSQENKTPSKPALTTSNQDARNLKSTETIVQDVTKTATQSSILKSPIATTSLDTKDNTIINTPPTNTLKSDDQEITSENNNQQNPLINQNQTTPKDSELFPDLKPTGKNSNPTDDVKEIILIQTLYSSISLFTIDTEPIAITLPFLTIIKPETKPDYTGMTGLTLGVNGLYLTSKHDLGIEGYVGYGKQLSPSFGIEYRMGYGRLSISEDSESTLSTFEDAVGPPLGAGSADPEEPNNNNPVEEEIFRIDPAQLEQFSSANLSSLNVFSNGIYTNWQLSRRIGISVFGGLDYIHNPSFRSLFVVNGNQLLNEILDVNSLQGQVQNVQFSINNEWKFNTGIDLVYRITPAFSFSAGYKYYLSNLINNEIETNINQARLGLRYKF